MLPALTAQSSPNKRETMNVSRCFTTILVCTSDASQSTDSQAMNTHVIGNVFILFVAAMNYFSSSELVSDLKAADGRRERMFVCFLI